MHIEEMRNGDTTSERSRKGATSGNKGGIKGFHHAKKSHMKRTNTEHKKGQGCLLTDVAGRHITYLARNFFSVHAEKPPREAILQHL